MIYTPYSWSKISTFRQCPRKFKYQYIDKLPVQYEPSVHLDRGTLVHLIFELERNVQEIKKHKDFKRVLKNGLLGPEGIKECFSIYDNFVSSDRGKKIMNLPRVFAELPLGLDSDLNITKYDDPEVLLRGYIDDARHFEDNDSIMVCNDWKTGKVPQEQKWGQLLYYSLGLFSRAPVDRILLNYIYVEHDTINSKIVHRDSIERYKTALYKTLDTIEKTEDFVKEESPLCDYCQYQEFCND